MPGIHLLSFGRINEVLERLTNLLRADMRLKNTIKGMMTYPIVLFGIMIVVLCILVFIVLPQFAKVFVDLEHPLPL